MYTKGIRKLFSPLNAQSFEKAINATIAAGYTLLLWNGCVYIVLDNKDTVNTTLTIEDFQSN